MDIGPFSPLPCPAPLSDLGNPHTSLAGLGMQVGAQFQGDATLTGIKALSQMLVAASIRRCLFVEKPPSVHLPLSLSAIVLCPPPEEPALGLDKAKRWRCIRAQVPESEPEI